MRKELGNGEIFDFVAGRVIYYRNYQLSVRIVSKTHVSSS
jgi:hypothetical protein